MPRIFDNIDEDLLPSLRDALGRADRADFCVGYFNLRGWKRIADEVEELPGSDEDGPKARLLVGMHRAPREELARWLSDEEVGLDQGTVVQLRRQLAEDFRNQLTFGTPTDADERGLRQLARQLRDDTLRVKLFLRHPLHAKLYLAHRPSDRPNPIIGFLGSSNLTLGGLSGQGELNVDVVESDAGRKLANWFEARWDDRWCVEITEDLVEILEESWAREEAIPPYHIYLTIAYHLSREAREGLSDFRIPDDLEKRLFDYQRAAVKIAAHHINTRGGVLLGDVVGLGKTLMATTIARLFEDVLGPALIISPKNLVEMWRDHVDRYELRARVVPITQVQRILPELRRFQLVVIDESHNLRNRDGKRYRAIRGYIHDNDAHCVLLSATPYNKTYEDLSNQLRLFLSPEQDLGIRPENHLRAVGETEFRRRHQAPLRSLAAFEKSNDPDDWRELMRLFLVRRTRSFIRENYAETDPATGRKYLIYPDGSRSYFPDRVPRRATFELTDDDPYARLYASDVVDAINGLHLPRYGYGNYAHSESERQTTQREAELLQDLSRAGKQLMGFCRTGLFKRLESSGEAFLLSVERHVLRNYVVAHAVEQGQPIPIGSQDAALLDPNREDEDVETSEIAADFFEEEGEENGAAADPETEVGRLRSEAAFRARAAELYERYRDEHRHRFRWLSSDLFVEALGTHLVEDARRLIEVLKIGDAWGPNHDSKLTALERLLTETHPDEKVLVFSQYADTVRYLVQELRARGLTRFEGVTGQSDHPTRLAWRFAPVANEREDRIEAEDELRVLISTDVLSEGQNLQDGHIVVNYDMPWTIIPLIQRAGRVDRIGQQAEEILCYTFWPAEGVERILNLRGRVRRRLEENAEVLGTDERFFDEPTHDQTVVDLYNENAGVLDEADEGEVDLASYAFQIWKNAIEEDPSLESTISDMPPVVYSTKPWSPPHPLAPEGALVYVQTGRDTDALAWIDSEGRSVTESQFEILRAARCEPDTPALERHENHHELVQKGVEWITEEAASVGGGLGRPSGARFRVYERLKEYARSVRDTLFDTRDLERAIEDIYRFPLTRSATDTINQQLRAKISREQLAELVLTLRSQGRLVVRETDEETGRPVIICSLGLRESSPETPDAS